MYCPRWRADEKTRLGVGTRSWRACSMEDRYETVAGVVQLVGGIYHSINWRVTSKLGPDME
jgi:hypothetical protein